MSAEPRYLTPREIEASGLADADTARYWIASGQLPAFNAGKLAEGGKPRWKILAADLAAFLAARSNRPATVQPARPAARRKQKRAASKIKFF